MLDSFSHDAALAAAVIVAGFAIILVWAMVRWRKLKPVLFPVEPEASSLNAALSAGMIGSADILRMTRNWLTGQGSSTATRALAALAAIEGAGPSTETIEKLFGKAFETDDVASDLIRTSDGYIYLLAVPDRYENARGLGRYRGFADGWRSHLAALYDRIAVGPSAAPLVAFLFFLDPNKGESAVLLSFADKEDIVVPAVLAQPSDQVSPVSDDVNLAMEFRLAA